MEERDVQIGGLIAQGSQFGISVAFMRFSREFERQADIQGSHIMAGVAQQSS